MDKDELKEPPAVEKARKKAAQMYDLLHTDLKEQCPPEVVAEHHLTGRLAGEVAFTAMHVGLDKAMKTDAAQGGQTTSIMSALEALIAAIAVQYQMEPLQVADKIIQHFLGPDPAKFRESGETVVIEE